MKFTKMQGLGNDYIYINAFEEQADDLSALARRMSDRHFGVGGDGLVLIAPSDNGGFPHDHVQRGWFARSDVRQRNVDASRNTYTTAA